MKNEFSIRTAKRPVGILRFNAEKMRDNGAPAEVIEQYLADNGVDFNVIAAVPTPNENERARMLAAEQDGSWAERQQIAEDAAVKAENSRKKLETLQGIQGGVRSFGNGLFLNYGDELESWLTGQDVDQIRQEQSDWSHRNPTLDLALGIAGGVAPVLATGGGGALATGGAAGKSLLTRAGLGGLYGLGTGAVAGYGAGTGDWKNRAEMGLYGSLLGGGIGTVTPLALGGLGRATGRIFRGLGKGPTEQQIDDFVLDNVIGLAGKPSNQARRNASILLQGIQDGDTALQDAMANLHNKTTVALGQRNPNITGLAMSPNWTPQTASTQRIMSAFTTPSKTAAMSEFGNFVAQQPDVRLANDAIKTFYKNNPTAKTIVRANKRRLGYNKSPNELTTYEGLQKIDQTLDRNLPKNLDNNRVVNRNAKILDAKEDLANLRETLFPGQSKMDAMYRASSSVQENAQKKALGFLEQLASGTTNPTNMEVSLTGASKLGFKPYVRGRARELILKGSLEPDTTSTLENLLRKAAFGTYRTLEEQR